MVLVQVNEGRIKEMECGDVTYVVLVQVNERRIKEMECGDVTCCGACAGERGSHKGDGVW